MTKLEQAIQKLKSGEVVGIPTETVYGLAASINSSKGIDAIFETKERPFFDPLIVHVSSIEQAKNLVKSWPTVCDVLAKEYWPGPVTFILPKNDTVSEKITSGLNTVGIRMPNHQLTINLIEQLGHPIAAPSANKFKKTSPTCADDVKNAFSDILVLDGGDCKIGIESTILGIFENEILIYRPGMTTKSEIEKNLSKNKISLEVNYQESPVAPGHLKHHYMPNIPVITSVGDTNSLSSSHIPENHLKKIVQWKLPKSATIAARELYSKFRELDSNGATAINIMLSESQFQDENFKGILNRLIKASSYTLPKELSNKS
jgi:L-threonylcarbamoyladenylate synthase